MNKFISIILILTLSLNINFKDYILDINESDILKQTILCQSELIKVYTFIIFPIKILDELIKDHNNSKDNNTTNQEKKTNPLDRLIFNGYSILNNRLMITKRCIPNYIKKSIELYILNISKDCLINMKLCFIFKVYINKFFSIFLFSLKYFLSLPRSSIDYILSFLQINILSRFSNLLETGNFFCILI